MAKVLLFGRLAEIAGWRERAFEPAPARLSDLRELIGRLDPDLAAALAGPGVRAAIDKAMIIGDAAIPPGAEVAFMPPMSGG
ncbi:MAG: MoaD/ThiS family protein [Caulobacteraceae bacterium]